MSFTRIYPLSFAPNFAGVRPIFRASQEGRCSLLLDPPNRGMRVTALSDLLELHRKMDLENRVELRTLNIGFDHVNRRLDYGHSRVTSKILLEHLKCLSRRLDTYDMLRAVLQIEESRFTTVVNDNVGDEVVV